MHSSILDRIKLESELHGVLDHKELSLVYQPIVDLNTNCLVGFEALVRWNHSTRGMVYPTEFIPLAEETGLISKIGEWILREACRELGKLQRRFPSQPPLKMSINISGKQFAQENLADLVAEIIQDSGVVPHSLAIEITESMLMENIDVAIETMNRLRDMGVHIHIDDFGTGYSSLSYLHSLPINALKIDRSFVKKLTAKGDNQEIILSIISLARSLNFDVIAEGVELNHQLEQMKELECRFGQGFIFSEPMQPGDIDAWIKSEGSRYGKR
jgi:EAL domain-containing protein (putative c-di-GMP-specific phosphodiesterase class I)